MFKDLGKKYMTTYKNRMDKNKQKMKYHENIQQIYKDVPESEAQSR
jgi:hypothetical protein